MAHREDDIRTLTNTDSRIWRDVVFACGAVGALAIGSFALTGVGRKSASAVFLAVLVAAVVLSYRHHRDAAAARRELANVSMLDSLTDLANRRALPELYATASQRAAQTGSPFAVLFIGLDRFKTVNDSFGHEAGDKLIVAIAHRLEAATLSGDRVIRYGGDEFVMLCNDTATTPTVLRLAQRLVALVNEPIDVSGEWVTVSASIGGSLVHGEHATMDQVLSSAESAVTRAKGRGTGQCVVLEPGHRRPDDRQRLLDQLHRAYERGEFVLHYQPIVSMADKSMIGVEALLRWQHPERGLLLPGLFVEELEESGLIMPVGEWVLERACRQTRVWTDAFPERAFRVAVNLSGHQLSDPSFSELVIHTLRRTGVEPSRLCFEITESAIMDDIDRAWATLRASKELGVELSLDDFGTGYSSLSYLRRFKTDLLKIDRTFVDGVGRAREDTAIVEHVIGLAHSLGMLTVAEGIEREDQYAQLLRYGCDHGQGFWFSPAQPVEIINQLLDISPEPRERTHAASESQRFLSV